MKSKTIAAATLWVCHALFLGSALSGCAREIPEGYAKVRIGFGGTAPFQRQGGFRLFPSLRANLQETCTIPALGVHVHGPEIDPPVRIPLEAAVDLAVLSSLASGDRFFDIPGLELMVKKGIDRIFSLSGLIYSECTTGTALPIYGRTAPIEVSGVTEVAVQAAIFSSGFQVGAQNQIDISDTQFVKLAVNWVQPPLTCGFNSVPGITVVDHVSGAHLTDVPGGNFSSSGFGGPHEIGPLFPFRLYAITYTADTGSNPELFTRYYFATGEANQSLSVDICQ